MLLDNHLTCTDQKIAIVYKQVKKNFLRFLVNIPTTI